MWRPVARPFVRAAVVRHLATRTPRKRTHVQPRKTPPTPPPPTSAPKDPTLAEALKGPTEALKADAAWVMSEERTEHLNSQEKWVMRIAVGSCAIAIASFTYTKWEVEKRLADELNDEERAAWYAGTYNHEEAQAKRRMEASLIRGPVPLVPVSLNGFVAAAAFEGPREGMVFKRDLAGLGYYVDQPLVSRVDLST